MKTKAILVIAVASLVGFYYLNKTQEVIPDTQTEEIHYHAGFQLYKDDELFDFAKLEFMKVEPCGAEPQVDEQLEKAHLHDNIGDVVHVHRLNATWADFFTNINYPLPETATAYDINGELIASFPDSPIKAYDSIIVFEDEPKNLEEKFVNRVTQDHIFATEQRSENCGS